MSKQEFSQIKIEILYGHIEIRGGFALNKNGDLVGMGMTKEFDGDGALIKTTVRETGLIVR